MNLRRALVLYLAYMTAVKAGQQRRVMWSSSTADYYYQDNGRPISSGRINEVWEQYLADVNGDIDRFTDSMLRGRTSVDAWRRQMRDHMRDVTRLGYITGRGGKPQMTAHDWGKVGAEVRRQNAYIEHFAEQLANGTAGSPGQIMARAGQYGRAPRKMVNAGGRAAKESAGYTSERRIAVMDKGTCARCAELAAKGWQPLGSLPLPGEDTPCGANCRCSMDYKGTPILSQEEIDLLFEKVQREYAETGFSGYTYNTMTDELEDEGYALSIYKERERRIPMEQLAWDDIRDYGDHNADKIKDQSKFPHRFGAWTEGGELVLDVSMLLPKDNLLKAAMYVVKYDQDAMFELHTFTELKREDCISMLINAGMLPDDYVDPKLGKEKGMHIEKDRQVQARPGKKWLMMITPKYQGQKDPKTGRRNTFEDYIGQIFDIGRFFYLYHGAERMTNKSGLQFIVRQYRQTEGVDIEKFWKARPELKPTDWDDQKDIYMNGHPIRWEKLAWDEGLDLEEPK